MNKYVKLISREKKYVRERIVSTIHCYIHLYSHANDFNEITPCCFVVGYTSLFCQLLN